MVVFKARLTGWWNAPTLHDGFAAVFFPNAVNFSWKQCGWVHRIWTQGACHWLNITLISHFTFLVPQFPLWVYNSYVLLQSMLRTPVFFLPSTEVLGLGIMLELSANQNLFLFFCSFFFEDMITSVWFYFKLICFLRIFVTFSSLTPLRSKSVNFNLTPNVPFSKWMPKTTLFYVILCSQLCCL